MEIFKADPVGEVLGSFNIWNFKEYIIVHAVGNVLFQQLMGMYWYNKDIL